MARAPHGSALACPFIQAGRAEPGPAHSPLELHATFVRQAGAGPSALLRHEWSPIRARLDTWHSFPHPAVAAPPAARNRSHPSRKRRLDSGTVQRSTRGTLYGQAGRIPTPGERAAAAARGLEGHPPRAAPDLARPPPADWSCRPRPQARSHPTRQTRRHVRSSQPRTPQEHGAGGPAPSRERGGSRGGGLLAAPGGVLRPHLPRPAEQAHVTGRPDNKLLTSTIASRPSGVATQTRRQLADAVAVGCCCCDNPAAATQSLEDQPTKPSTHLTSQSPDLSPHPNFSRSGDFETARPARRVSLTVTSPYAGIADTGCRHTRVCTPPPPRRGESVRGRYCRG